MSVQDEEELQSVQHILGLDSILQLTRRLAQRINEVNKSDGATHLKIYEGLLSKRPNKDLQQNEILSLCIQNASKEEGTSDRLLSLISSLSGLENGREIVQFLALMGKKGTEKPKSEKTKFFSCPKEMLDGSLFARPPLEEGSTEFYRSTFAFSSQPGTNLPLCSKFLNLKNESGVAKKEKHHDLGYSSSEDSEVDWEAVAKMGPPPPRRTWEQLGKLQPSEEKPLLSDICSFQGHRTQISRKEFITHLGYLLVGIPSDTFPYSEELKSFILAKDLQVEGVSPKAVADLVKPMIACGSSHFHLNNFGNANERSRVIQAIQRSVKNLLLLHRKTVQNLLSGNEDRLIAVFNSMHWVSAPIVGVAAFCVPPAGKRLKALVALEQLGRICSQVVPGRTASVFYSLLKSAAEAYLRILWAWIFDGELPEDKKSEFLIQAQAGTLMRRDRAFWADSFVVLENRVPSFLKGLEGSIKQCGTALSFLKLCKKNHPLFNVKKRPPVVCCLNDAELDRLKVQCYDYMKEALDVCGAPVTAAEQLEINQEQQQEFLAMVAIVRQQRLEEIRAAQRDEREKKAEKRRKLKEELAQQIEEVKARKVEQLKKEQEEEEKFSQQLIELQQKQLKMLEEEKERIRRQYYDYNKVPEEKLASTEAEIQVLRDELDQLNASIQGTDASIQDTDPIVQEQNESFQDVYPTETESLQVDNINLNELNKNLSDSEKVEPCPDTNANVSPRKVPTSLALKEVSRMDNSAALAAAKNKTRVLSHEYNLIQNYDQVDAVSPMAVTPDSKELSDMWKQRADEAARNKARVMHHEFFKEELLNTNKKVVDNFSTQVLDNSGKTLDIKCHLAEPDQADGCDSSPVFEDKCPVLTPLDTPDTQPSAMSISSEGSPAEAPIKPFPASASNYSVSSMLSAMSEPRKWPSTSSRDSVNSFIRENSADCSTHTKHSFLHHTVSVVLNTQVRLANEYVLHVFLHELQVLSHFRSLRNFFLLLDGEFGARLTSRLCSEVETFRENPAGLLNFASLNYLLQNMLVGCDDPNKERLSLSFRSTPSRFNPAESNLLGCLQLQYEAGWPLNSVLTGQVLRTYDALFSFVLSLRRVVWVLDQTFRHLKTCDAQTNKKVLNNSPQHRTLSLQLFEMSAFFRAFHSYVLNVAIVQQWPKCEAALKKVSSLDALYEVHYRMFLKSVLYRCLLRKEAAQIQEMLGATMRPVLRFYTLLVAHPWTLQGDVYTHPQFKSLCLEYRKYHERTNMLAKNLSKLATRGYQSDLQDLCDYLRMNDFYSVLVVDPSPSMASSTTSSLKSR